MKILDERAHNQKLETRVEALLLKVNTLENNLTTHRQKIRSLEGKVNTLKGTVEDLETKVKRVRRRRVKRRHNVGLDQHHIVSFTPRDVEDLAVGLAAEGKMKGPDK